MEKSVRVGRLARSITCTPTGAWLIVYSCVSMFPSMIAWEQGGSGRGSGSGGGSGSVRARTAAAVTAQAPPTIQSNGPTAHHPLHNWQTRGQTAHRASVYSDEGNIKSGLVQQHHHHECLPVGRAQRFQQRPGLA